MGSAIAGDLDKATSGAKELLRIVYELTGGWVETLKRLGPEADQVRWRRLLALRAEVGPIVERLAPAFNRISGSNGVALDYEIQGVAGEEQQKARANYLRTQIRASNAHTAVFDLAKLLYQECWLSLPPAQDDEIVKKVGELWQYIHELWETFPRLRDYGGVRDRLQWEHDAATPGKGNGGGDSTPKKAPSTKTAEAPSKRGRPVDEMTIQRANFAKPLHEQGKTWEEIAAEYKKKHQNDLEASADTIRLACTPNRGRRNEPK